MRHFRDLPIARKTLTLGLVPTVFALLVAILSSLLSTYITARGNQHRDVDSQATIVAGNIGAGLARGDEHTVDHIIEALNERPNIDLVCVYNMQGHPFASFQREGFACPGRWPAPVPSTVPTAATTAMAGDVVVGTVFIRGNYSGLFNWMRQQSVVAVLALICGFLVAVTLTQYLRQYLTVPILDLTGTLDRIAQSGDYSTRAARKTNDEVGHLVDSFNSMLGVIERKDIERNQLLRKTQESNRVKDEFLATVSHELRTPLNAMLGWLQIVRSTNMDPAMLERAINSIERNAQSQARVVEDLIELSRMAMGKLQLRTKPADLRGVVEAAIDVVRTAARAKGVAITTNMAPAAAIVSGDRDRLQQVIWNLLSNAVKFTESGGTITVDLSCDDQRCAVAVTDSGKGITPEFLPHVFERFRQADQSSTREHGGLGLGLAIAKEITELHGGTLEASSAGRGHGSRFTLTLPRLNDTALRTSDGENEERPDLAGTRILVVDDDPESREIASKALATTGATITEAGSGAEAVERWSAGGFDVLVCDLAMPGMDGYEVLRRIRSAPSAGARRPAIALTALASDADRKAVLAAGFDAHIVKPFNFPDLLRAVSRSPE